MATETDRELLELAAKAAGIQIIGPVEKFIAQPNNEHLGGFIIRNDRGGDSVWNPLGDDGDALRLAVKLYIVMAFGKDGLTAYTEKKDVVETYSSDAYAASRRAIVRAAAEFGRTMP